MTGAAVLLVAVFTVWTVQQVASSPSFSDVARPHHAETTDD